MFLILSLILIAFFSITAYGVFQIKANYFLNSVNKLNASAVCLTFDDGPDPEITPKILQVLESANIKAAFFVIGKKAELYPDLINEIQKRGHVVGNHSYSHDNMLPFFSFEKFKADIEKCSIIIEKLTGNSPALFRPPFGITNPKYSKMLRQLKMTSIGWSVRSLDTMANDKNTLVNKVTKAIKPGSILLFHDTKAVTLSALPEIIEYCNKNGIKVANATELLPFSNA